MLTVRVREGMTETRGMKSITAVPDVTDPRRPSPCGSSCTAGAWSPWRC